MAKLRQVHPARALPELSPQQVEFWREQLAPMISRSVVVSQIQLHARRELRGSEAAEILDLLHRHGLVHRWDSEMPQDVHYVPTYLGCVFAGLSGKAARAAWRRWLQLHPTDTPGWDVKLEKLIRIRDSALMDRETPESRNTMLLEFLVNLCVYSQKSPQMSRAGSVEDEDYLMAIVSYQVACFLANYTVDGSDGVEPDIVFADLTGPDRSHNWWRSRLRKLAKSYNGWKAAELGTLNFR